MKILCLDGGGVFGRTQAKILAQANCLEKFDMFVGTSIGSILAMSYSLGLGREASPEFFDKWMPKIFEPSFFRTWNPWRSKYSDEGLNKALQTLLGSKSLKDANKPVFVTAANVGQQTLKVFSSTNFDDASQMAWEVGRCATAAETYFDSWKGYADGGVFANNPSMVGVAAAIRVLNTPPQEIEVLSIGTGKASTDGSVPGSRLSWGIWLIGALLEGASDDMHDYFVRSLNVKRYERIQFIRDPSWGMDEPRCMYYADTKWALETQAAVQIVKEF